MDHLLHQMKVDQFLKLLPQSQPQACQVPEELQPQLQLLGYISILSQAELAPSTQKTYQRLWRTMETFFTNVLGESITLPLSVSTISLFVAHLFKLSFASITISTYFSARACVHKMLSLPDNTRAFFVEKLVMGSSRLTRKVDVRLPITIPVLSQLLTVIPCILSSIYEQLLFKAVYLFAFSVFARIGELVVVPNVPETHVLQLHDVSFSYTQGVAHKVLVTFQRYKHFLKHGPTTISFHMDRQVYLL